MTLTVLPAFSVTLYKKYCPSTTNSGDIVYQPTEIYFPIPPTATDVPTAPTIDTAPELIPPNSAVVDECFDPDNVDLSQIFNNLLPADETEAVYDSSITTDVLLRAKNQIYPIRAVLRSVFGVYKAEYSIATKITEIPIFNTRILSDILDLEGQLIGEATSVVLTGKDTVLQKTVGLACVEGTFALTGIASALSLPGSKNLIASSAKYLLNAAPEVLLLSHFDSDFDEQTGNTVGYNWYSTAKPGISTSTKKIGAGSLDLDFHPLGYLYTFLSPALYPEAINSFTIEAWGKKNVSNNYAIPFGIGPEANAENTGYFIELNSSLIRFKSSVVFGAVTTIFEGDIEAYEDPDFNHIVFEYDNGLARVYYNGNIVPNERIGGQPLQWSVGQGVGQLGELLDLRSSIMFGNYVANPVVDYPYTTYGFLDEVRIIAGVVYDGAAFIPSTEQYDTTSPKELITRLLKITNLTAVSGSFALTGQAASLNKLFTAISAEPGTYVLNGQDSNFVISIRKFAADAGAFTLTGISSISPPSVVGSVAGITSTGNVTLAWPGSYAAGDLAIVFTESTGPVTNAGARPCTPPYGWTPVPNSVFTDGYSYSSAYYKYATSGSEANLVTPSTTNHQVIAMVVLRGVDLNDPFVETTADIDVVANTAVAFPALVGTIPSTLLLEYICRGNDSTTALTITGRANASDAWVDAGLIIEETTNTGDGGGLAVYSATTTKQMFGLTGSTGTTNISHTNTLMTIALRPKGWTEPPLVVGFAPVVGSYALVGQAAGLAVPLRTLGAADGTYTLVGYSASFEKGFVLEAESATYSLGGQSAGLAVPLRSLVADAGAFVEVGQDIALLDGTADTYIAAVESADGQDLETTVKVAINKFITGCKADGTWSAIKAACILAGARTLAGALVPLAGTAPTNNNFVSGDYSRTTGLVGDGSTKYLDSNRNANAQGQDNLHFSVFLTNAGSTNTSRNHIATPYAGVASSDLSDISALSDNRLIIRNRNANGDTNNILASPAGSTINFIGSNRNSSTSHSYRRESSTTNVSTGNSATSYSPINGNFAIFVRPGTPPTGYSDARLSFYSIGESLDLALLDSRVTALVNEVAFYLNTGLDPAGYDIDTLKYINAGYAAGGSLS